MNGRFYISGSELTSNFEISYVTFNPSTNEYVYMAQEDGDATRYYRFTSKIASNVKIVLNSYGKNSYPPECAKTDPPHAFEVKFYQIGERAAAQTIYMKAGIDSFNKALFSGTSYILEVSYSAEYTGVKSYTVGAFAST